MTDLVSVETALQKIRENQLPKLLEERPLTEAFGCRLAKDVIARVDRPPAAVSAMDGYAVRFADAQVPNASFRIVGTAPAGYPYDGAIGKGEAVRIFTGGVVPEGADHIIIQEDVQLRDDHFIAAEAAEVPAYVRPRGMDFRRGEVVVAAGQRLGPAELGLIAAANHAGIEITRPLRFGILANGDELVAPGERLRPGQIINSNPFALGPLIQSWGGIAVDLGIAGDSIEAIQNVIETAEDIDVFLPIGGASVGDHDYMRAAFYGAGFKPIFEKVAVRPGKPTWFGAHNAKYVLGLPGNPASAYVCAHLFAAPLLGEDPADMTLTAQLKVPLNKNGGREHFMRASASIDGSGQCQVMPAPDQDSSLFRPLTMCNALLRRRPNAPALDVGARVDILLLRPIERV